MACTLFGICLSLFLEQKSEIGRVVALDEAHKYMTDGAECQALTESLLSTIRLQRHLGTRVIVSTQEPTIDTRLLDLCSITIVHHFTSPAWLEALKKHLAGASDSTTAVQGPTCSRVDAKEEQQTVVHGAKPISLGSLGGATGLFKRIVSLRTGEALIFAPSAVVTVIESVGGSSVESDNDEDDYTGPLMLRLGYDILKVRIRKRVTEDGGRSIMAN